MGRGNHPYTSHERPDGGCPLIGKQCPIEADQSPAYDIDLGYPERNVYMELLVENDDPEEKGMRAILETRRVPPKSPLFTMKKHYGVNFSQVLDAYSACEQMDGDVLRMEADQVRWMSAILINRRHQTESDEFAVAELEFMTEAVRERATYAMKIAAWSGVVRDGELGIPLDAPDTRSSEECDLAIVWCDAAEICLTAIEERMSERATETHSLASYISNAVEMIQTLRTRSKDTSTQLPGASPHKIRREARHREELVMEAKRVCVRDYLEYLIVLHRVFAGEGVGAGVEIQP